MAEVEETIPTTESEECVATQEKGIDVSNHQGMIDWTKVKNSGVKHVCMKMSEGATFVDKTFAQNWKSATDAKLGVNCYHYFRALGCTPEDQMKNIKTNTKAVGFDPKKNVLAIDVEEKGNESATPEQMADRLNALLALIKKDSVLSAATVMIYTSYGYWDTKVKWNKYNFGEYKLWVAHWGAKEPKLPQPWKSWFWWQYSDSGSVDGIKTAVDLDWVKK